MMERSSVSDSPRRTGFIIRSNSTGESKRSGGMDHAGASTKVATVGIEGVKKWVRADLNCRPPPCQGGVITSLDHEPSLALVCTLRYPGDVVEPFEMRSDLWVENTRPERGRPYSYDGFRCNDTVIKMYLFVHCNAVLIIVDHYENIHSTSDRRRGSHANGGA